MSSEVMASLKKDYIYNLMLKGKREDGRLFDEYRNITVQTNIIEKAEGSAKVCIGDTQVLVGCETSSRCSIPGFTGLKEL